MSHTPGPWRWVGKGHNLSVKEGDELHSDGEMCGVLGVDYRVPNDANARLIAAAPELLAACEALHARLFREQGGQPNSPWAAPLAVLQKAICKAKGGGDMNRACWEFVLSESTVECLVIRDVGPWDRHPTVTNDAEAVVVHLARTGYLNGRRLLYYDSEGNLDELRVVNGRFAGFIPHSQEGRRI